MQPTAKTKTGRIFLVAAALCMHTGLFSQTESLTPAHFSVVDAVCARFAEANHIPGMSYGIVVDGRLVHKGSVGQTDLSKKTAVGSSSVFRIASMTKSFTAMAILRLRDSGVLKLDDPAYLYVPELKKVVYPSLDSETITIRHLLTHGAGFPEDNPWGDRQLADTDKDLADLLSGGLNFSTSPGTAYEYSNLGFAILGRIITRTSGMPYQRYIAERIWQPLGMKSAAWEYSTVPSKLLAHGYRWQEGRWLEEELLHDQADGSWGAMGSMLCSVDDFAGYMSLHLSAWPPSDVMDNGPVGRAAVREMHHPWRFSGFNPRAVLPGGRTCASASAYGYGLRWGINCDGNVTVGHSGGLPGFGSNWQIMPQLGIGVVSMGNRTYAPMSALNTEILDTLVRMAGLKPRPYRVSEILDRRKKELARLLPDWKNAERSHIFAENFFPDRPIHLLRKESQEIFERIGPVRHVEDIVAENNLRGTFRIVGEKGVAEVYFTLTPENPPLIQEFGIREVRK
jgi:CubicO group peptidase (beta-lactamase class C family)